MTWHIRIWSLNHDSVVTVEGLARIAEFRALAAADDVYAQLTAALAPSIWQLDDVKKGVLCQARSVVTRRVLWRSENQERAGDRRTKKGLEIGEPRKDEDEAERVESKRFAAARTRGRVCADWGATVTTE